MNTYDKAVKATNHIKSKLLPNTLGPIESAVILGTGADKLIERFDIKKVIKYRDIPHMPAATFHKGELILAETKSGRPVLLMNGRLHYYEGYSAKEVGFPVRILQLLGIKNLYMTNAAGGLNPDYQAGEIVLVNDHINLLPDNPLRGENDDRLGLRFPDMSNAYDSELRKKVKLAWQKIHNNIIREGVYACFQGPSLETPAEYNFLNRCGADLVGMSTVPEVIVAKHAGMAVCVISVVTNVCYPPEQITPTTVEEVIEMADRVSVKIGQVLEEVIE